MKKLLVIVSLVFVGMAANAQVYMGGSFNFSGNQVKDVDGNLKTTDLTISLFPEIGYYLTDKVDIGLDLGIGSTINKNHSSDVKTTTTNWLFSPYIRFSVIQAGDFEFIGKASAYVEGNKNYTSFGVQLVPIVVYNLNDHIAMHANLNFLSIGSSYSKVKDGNSTTSFNMGFNANNLATIGTLTIGFIFKF